VWSFQRSVRGLEHCIVAGHDELKSESRTRLRLQCVGAAGSGKSTLSKAVADHFGLAYVRLDNFKSKLKQWKTVQRAEFEAAVGAELAAAQVGGGGWVCDGMYHTLPRPGGPLTSEATAVIWLDYSPGVVFYRLLSRAFKSHCYCWLLLIVLFPIACICIIYVLGRQWHLNLQRRRQYHADILERKARGFGPVIIVFRSPAECDEHVWRALAVAASDRNKASN